MLSALSIAVLLATVLGALGRSSTGTGPSTTGSCAAPTA